MAKKPTKNVNDPLEEALEKSVPAVAVLLKTDGTKQTFDKKLTLKEAQIALGGDIEYSRYPVPTKIEKMIGQKLSGTGAISVYWGMDVLMLQDFTPVNPMWLEVGAPSPIYGDILVTRKLAGD